MINHPLNPWIIRFACVSSSLPWIDLFSMLGWLEIFVTLYSSQSIYPPLQGLIFELYWCVRESLNTKKADQMFLSPLMDLNMKKKFQTCLLREIYFTFPANLWKFSLDASEELFSLDKTPTRIPIQQLALQNTFQVPGWHLWDTFLPRAMIKTIHLNRESQWSRHLTQMASILSSKYPLYAKMIKLNGTWALRVCAITLQAYLTVGSNPDGFVLASDYSSNSIYLVAWFLRCWIVQMLRCDN